MPEVSRAVTRLRREGAPVYTSSKDWLIDIGELIGSWENLELVESAIKDLEYISDLIERENAIAKQAFLATVEQFTENIALEYIKAKAREAIFNTVEFNFDGWPDRLMSALEAHKMDIFAIDFDINGNGGKGKLNRIYVLLYSLGDLHDYGNAVQAAREALGITQQTKGASPPEHMSQPFSGDDLASYLWMEKYYKPAREGASIRKWKTKKVKVGQNEDGSWEKETQGQWVDVEPAKYIAKYFATMSERLSQIPADQAPFWELIDKGNADIGFGLDESGTPYPIFPGQNFVSKAENALMAAFNEAYATNLEVAKDKYIELIGGKKTGTLQDAFEQLGEDIVAFLLLVKENFPDIKVNQAVGQVVYNNRLYDVIRTSTEKFGLRYRFNQ